MSEKFCSVLKCGKSKHIELRTRRLVTYGKCCIFIFLLLLECFINSNILDFTFTVGSEWTCSFIVLVKSKSN